MNVAGWIYFVQNGNPNLCKIGFSADPYKRPKKYQTGSPEKLRHHPIWSPVRAFKSQEDELHRLLKKWQYGDGGKEWFDISSMEARSIVDGFRGMLVMNFDLREEKNLSLFDFALQQQDFHKKYELGEKWPIRDSNDPDWPWSIICPNGREIHCKTLRQAKFIRRSDQYRLKYYGGRNVYWVPDDCYD